MTNKFIMVEDKEIPAHWDICESCDGEGGTSSHLGAFTSEEFYEAFETEEDQQRYFNGGYDNKCDECNGTGKVLYPNWDDLSEDDARMVELYLFGNRFERSGCGEY